LRFTEGNIPGHLSRKVDAMGTTPRKRGRERPPSRPSRARAWLVGAGMLAAALVGAGVFWFAGGGGESHAYTLAPESALPDYFRKAPPNVRDAYRFAIANRDILQQVPCYCGCGSDGHKNNADCYIKNVKPDGTVDFDRMSFG
jgi:hypothetical protein